MSSELAPWFERSFPFRPPVSLHPCLRSRLRGAPARLEELTGGLGRAALTRREGASWSILENAGHLLDLEPLWAARVDELLAGATTLRPADLTNRRTHEAGHNEAPLAGLLASFRAARGALLARVDELPTAQLERSALHPRLQQPMRLVDLLYFVAEHDDHHLARIWELRAAAGSR